MNQGSSMLSESKFLHFNCYYVLKFISLIVKILWARGNIAHDDLKAKYHCVSVYVNNFAMQQMLVTTSI